MNAKTLAMVKELLENSILLLDGVKNPNVSERAELRQIRDYANTIISQVNRLLK